MKEVFNSKEKRARIKALFLNDSGKECIEYMKEYVLRTSSFPAHAPDGQSLTVLQAMREGQINMVRQFIQMLEKEEIQNDGQFRK